MKLRILLTSAMLAIPAALHAQLLKIEAPVAPYDTFAEYRDFYVRGSFPATVRHPGNMALITPPGGRAGSTAATPPSAALLRAAVPWP